MCDAVPSMPVTEKCVLLANAAASHLSQAVMDGRWDQNKGKGEALGAAQATRQKG